MYIIYVIEYLEKELQEKYKKNAYQKEKKVEEDDQMEVNDEEMGQYYANKLK